MAEDDRDEGETEVNPVDLLKKVEKQAATNKILMIAAMAISGIIISVMATGMTVMFLRISALTEASQIEEEDPLEEQFIALEQQLMLLADFRKSELKKITAYTKQLDKIASDCSLEKAAPYQGFLSTRERDFQKLVTTIKTGTSDLAAMSKGSKKWLDIHNKTLDDLKDLSIERNAKLDKLIKRAK
ncbi:hypothetical protein [Oceanicoccus sagamiensis]|uniref:Uncharacterized protein n=1 Tax=Oceanicoccus sagamiensis TaxID=716816 RepID=A0A1X9NPQ1_9GAMM|nr:hypothetical protein [Oceanicoccus sagamiensis]ARN75863.1 hypothetical protein BST96_18195 [Oceanicoccus sagamiensis]